MKTIPPFDLDKLLALQPGLQVLDVRSPAEFAGAHALRARNVPLDCLNPRELYGKGLLSGDEPVYFLCQSGGRAKKAAEKFAGEGFDHGVVVEGGTAAWIEAGLPVERGTVTVMSLERQVRIAAGSLVLTGLLLAWFVRPAFACLSAFVGAGLVFAGITDFCGMGLLLAKLPWNNRKPD
jgi:rhodanese-related sulfurtransferase